MSFKKTKFDLSNKYALVTGAAGLLGYEHCIALLEVNANIIITDIDSYKLIETKSNLQAKFPNSKIISKNVDVTSINQITELSEDLKNINALPEILINNAAIDPKFTSSDNIELTRLENFSIEQWDKEISVGLTGAMLCSKVFGTFMARNKRGVIINIASDLSVISPDQRLYRKAGFDDSMQPVKPLTYSVIKHGLIGLTKYLATYWAKDGVRCNALSPGGVFNNHEEEFVQKLTSLIPMGRMANRDEYRSAIQFLSSDASSYLNGQNIVMDGGRSIW